MKKFIACPSCGSKHYKRFGVSMKTSAKLNFGSEWGPKFEIVIYKQVTSWKDAVKKKIILGYFCWKCGKHFPDQEEVKAFIKQYNTLEALKKHEKLY